MANTNAPKSVIMLFYLIRNWLKIQDYMSFEANYLIVIISCFFWRKTLGASLWIRCYLSVGSKPSFWRKYQKINSFSKTLHIADQSQERRTAAHCCNPALSFLALLVSRKVFTEVSALQFIVCLCPFVRYLWRDPYPYRLVGRIYTSHPSKTDKSSHLSVWDR